MPPYSLQEGLRLSKRASVSFPVSFILMRRAQLVQTNRTPHATLLSPSLFPLYPPLSIAPELFAQLDLIHWEPLFPLCPIGVIIPTLHTCFFFFFVCLPDVARAIELLEKLQESGDVPGHKLQSLKKVLQSEFCTAIREVSH